MGERGPARTPTPILKARGSTRARGRSDEVRYAAGAPDCPAWLSPRAKAEWARVLADPAVAGVIQVVDRAVLAAYCETWSEFTELCEAAATMSVADGIASGIAGAKRKCSAEVSRLAQQFGFTPASRSRVVPGAPPATRDPREGKFFGA